MYITSIQHELLNSHHTTIFAHQPKDIALIGSPVTTRAPESGQQLMSSSPSNNPSPSNPQTARATSAVTAALAQQPRTTSTADSAETPQVPAGRRSQSTPDFTLNTRSTSLNPRPAPPVVIIHEPRTSPVPRQGRSLLARSIPRTSSSQSPRRFGNPYARLPPPLLRARSQPLSATMSSASTPSNTSTAGASSGSNPSYQLPYAPFPYPMPANGGSGQQSGTGKGK